MPETHGWAAFEPNGALTPYTFQRREVRPDDVAIEIDYCGVCATDLDAVRAATSGQPLVPGHEIIGRVTATGSDVTDFAPGDTVGIGTIVDSCGKCPACEVGRDNWCFDYPTVTYGGHDRVDGSPTFGGYSRSIVSAQRFVHPIPAALAPAAAAPLLCAGVTVFAPLTLWGAGPGKTVGVVGIGGLGHLAVKFAHAMGARTVVFTTSPGKAEAARALGADDVVLSTDPDAMAAWRWKLDLIIDTVGAAHAFEPYFDTLGLDGTHVFVGIHDENISFEPWRLLYGAKRLAGGSGEGPLMVRRMLDFSAQHGITADVEVLPAHEVNTALDRLARNDVRYRFVLDMAQA
ncbi:NAD(P)-dependent alcohol dehydrogenase [Amycolatopsis sp. NPDC098790]|uniref:NAD(P)-dependent alcohol dehydrogenase n=1 Tax=Amycolatopsis sp. NPDC098790 TaxID=3363939 RepID=UPI00382AE7CF